MWRLSISCFLSQLYFLALLAACVPFEAEPTVVGRQSEVITSIAQVEVSWLHDPEVRIIRVTFCCSPLMSPAEETAYLPEAQVWGDGRIIWVEHGPLQRVLVSSLSEEQMMGLLRHILEAGFFHWQDQYSSEFPPTDTPSRCIDIHMEVRSKQVCELEGGAPLAFEEIYMILTRGAGAEGKDYVPEVSYLSGFKVDESSLRANGIPLPEPDLEWPMELGISPAEAIQGIWIEGEPLARIWRAAMDNVFSSPIVVDESGAYGLVVQVPGVSLIEPPER